MQDVSSLTRLICLFVCYISNIFEEFRSVNLEKVSQFGFSNFLQEQVEVMHFWLEYCTTEVSFSGSNVDSTDAPSPALVSRAWVPGGGKAGSKSWRQQRPAPTARHLPQLPGPPHAVRFSLPWAPIGLQSAEDRQTHLWPPHATLSPPQALSGGPLPLGGEQGQWEHSVHPPCGSRAA